MTYKILEFDARVILKGSRIESVNTWTDISSCTKIDKRYICESIHPVISVKPQSVLVNASKCNAKSSFLNRVHICLWPYLQAYVYGSKTALLTSFLVCFHVYLESTHVS